ncbi:hypothetical protein J2S16_003960 [Cytobacillus kochii]|nr:hypothetical protein [Cytobacillus kochii]
MFKSHSEENQEQSALQIGFESHSEENPELSA